MNASDEFMAIGRIRRPHGLKGLMKVEVLTDFPDDIIAGREIFVSNGSERDLRSIEEVKTIKGGLLIRIEGVDTVEAAELLRDSMLEIHQSQAHVLEEDEYWHHDLIGSKVVADDGTDLGDVREIIETGSNDVLVVADEDGKESLIPVIKDVIVNIDTESRIIRIKLIPGLLGD